MCNIHLTKFPNFSVTNTYYKQYLITPAYTVVLDGSGQIKQFVGLTHSSRFLIFINKN